MGNTSENKSKKHICLGILAHVWASRGFDGKLDFPDSEWKIFYTYEVK